MAPRVNGSYDGVDGGSHLKWFGAKLRASLEGIGNEPSPNYSRLPLRRQIIYNWAFLFGS